MTSNPPRVSTCAGISVLVALCILVALGVWQVQRLSWKQSVLAAIDQAYDSPASSLDIEAITHDFEQARGQSSSPWPAPFFARGVLRGTYIKDKDIRIAPRTRDGQPGYHLLSPLLIDAGAGKNVVVWVNRGWIPYEMDMDVLPPLPAGRINLSGSLRVPARENIFVPHNMPEADQWYRLDLNEMAESKEIRNVTPFVFYIEGQGDFSASKDKAEEIYPVPVGGRPDLPNNHLQYAIFWFSMAGVMLAVFWLRFMRRDFR